MAPKPARTIPYRSARPEAATRAARVEVASSWSAMVTRAASTAATSAAVAGPGASRAVSAWATLCGLRRPPTTSAGTGFGLRDGRASTMVATIRRPAARSASARRSRRKGSAPPAATTAQRRRSASPSDAGAGPTGAPSHGSAPTPPEPSHNSSEASS